MTEWRVKRVSYSLTKLTSPQPLADQHMVLAVESEVMVSCWDEVVPQPLSGPGMWSGTRPPSTQPVINSSMKHVNTPGATEGSLSGT